MRFTDAEYEALSVRAASAGVSVQRFLADGAFASQRPKVAAPAALIAELAGLRRLTRSLSNNINQIARWLNSVGRPDARVTGALDSVQRAGDAARRGAGLARRWPAGRARTAIRDSGKPIPLSRTTPPAPSNRPGSAERRSAGTGVIAEIVRGDAMPDLISYLIGPGRHNEHVNQHLVAGYADAVFTAPGRLWQSEPGVQRQVGKEARDLGWEVEYPRSRWGVEVPRGHVWHCSLAIRADEGQLTDTQWTEAAHAMIDALGFSNAEGKAPCRWVAVRHGLSGEGNDHIHIAVNLVREDGTKAATPETCLAGAYPGKRLPPGTAHHRQAGK
jgi:hypothetical protein